MIWSCALRPQKPVMACLAFLTLAGCANHGPVRDIVAEADDAQCRSYGHDRAPMPIFRVELTSPPPSGRLTPLMTLRPSRRSKAASTA
jgi:hypothetical protein